MKLSSTLRFFAIVVAALALLCIVFPSEGIAVGGTTLRFPSLHKVLVREKQKGIDDLLVKRPVRDISGLRDSLQDCYLTLFEGQTRFWLPDDDVSFFDTFFEKAENAASDGQIVRIMHYGDSQIEMDRVTCRLRERMQQQFGGGGPGMLPLRQPVPTISFNQTATGLLKGQSTWGDSTFTRRGANFGPMLRSWRLSGSATMSLSASKGRYASPLAGSFSTLRVLFNNRPGPLSVSFRDRKGGATFSETKEEEGIGMISWQLDSATSSAALTLTGNADIYGVLVDNGPGVAVDNIGMRSTSGHQFKMVPLEQLAISYRLVDVSVIIMQFGGNSVPYLKSEKVIDSYCSRLGEQIDHVRQACPDAVILFVGPSDMSTMVRGQLATYPMLPTVVEKLHQMATEHGAAYWSIYDAMGGYNSMLVWHKEGLAGNDYVHFTHKGANLMGDYLADAILKLYQLYTLRKGLSASQFDQLWKETVSANATLSNL
ncbi:MAG: hypothetical protein IJP80_03175 [Bacteroidales bacterium]|nr:hypothetical protein [Bacteroidales bacterium]